MVQVSSNSVSSSECGPVNVCGQPITELPHGQNADPGSVLSGPCLTEGVL